MGRVQDLIQLGGASALLEVLASEGRIFYASDSAANALVTGQTSFASTTPTFLLDIPGGTTVIPLQASLAQAGTVAGGAVSVVMEFDNAVRYASGGTSETVFCSRTVGGHNQQSTLYSGATASAGYGVRVMGMVTGEDVSPAEGVINEIVWTPNGGLDYLVGPAAWLVFTWAASTGPSWLWSFKWAEVPSTWLD